MYERYEEHMERSETFDMEIRSSRCGSFGNLLQFSFSFFQCLWWVYYPYIFYIGWKYFIPCLVILRISICSVFEILSNLWVFSLDPKSFQTKLTRRHWLDTLKPLDTFTYHHEQTNIDILIRITITSSERFIGFIVTYILKTLLLGQNDVTI